MKLPPSPPPPPPFHNVPSTAPSVQITPIIGRSDITRLLSQVDANPALVEDLYPQIAKNLAGKEMSEPVLMLMVLDADDYCDEHVSPTRKEMHELLPRFAGAIYGTENIKEAGLYIRRAIRAIG